MLASLLAALAFGPGDPKRSDDVALKTLADRCGSQIEWMYDGRGQEDGGAAFKYLGHGTPLDDVALRKLIDDAIARAASEKKLVL